MDFSFVPKEEKKLKLKLKLKNRKIKRKRNPLSKEHGGDTKPGVIAKSPNSCDPFLIYILKCNSACAVHYMHHHTSQPMKRQAMMMEKTNCF